MRQASRWLATVFVDLPPDQAPMQQALTHRSFAKQHNERLEFLGDAVLDVIIAEALFERFPEANEGVLSRYRAELVRGEQLANIARAIGLAEHMRFATGELNSGGKQRDSNLAGAFEAVVGVLYQHYGFSQCCQTVLPLFTDLLHNAANNAERKDPKTQLQEWLQARKQPLPNYQLLDIVGQDHQQQFTVELELKAFELVTQAHGRSKKQAQQAAAEAMLALLREHSSTTVKH